ncbi:nuclear transport factor 2 family protein [Nocardioides gilvus]|uniref:nuclear transport factor 2 family protein n=1 Tax=Nocardioides gilvus TaxID=1735589 RepID=UPI000D745348|nr:nuclear transport factor 2 family protein [Nocardioides gilvus]
MKNTDTTAASSATPTPVDAATRVAIDQLLAEYNFLLDHGRADELWTLVAEEFVSHGPMGVMDGRDALKAWGARRVTQDAGEVRHFTGGTSLRWEDGALTGVTYYMTFRSTLPEPTHPASVGEFHQTFVEVDGVWKIRSRDVVAVFGGANAAAHAQRVSGSPSDRTEGQK